MNTAEITLGGRTYQLRASNYASQVYADTFFGRIGGAYNASLAHDTAQMIGDCVGDINDNDTMSVHFVTPVLWGIVWALAYAGGSVTVDYDAWRESVRDEVWYADDEADACVTVFDLVSRSFFRQRSESSGKEPTA